MDKRVRKSDGFVFKVLEVILYISYVIIGFYLAFMIRFEMNPSLHNIQPYFDSIPYIIVATLIIFYIYNIISTFKKSLFENALIIFISLLLINLATVVIVFFNRGFAFPRSIFLIGFMIQFLLIFTTKYLILKLFKSTRKEKDILIVVNQMEEAGYIAKKILLDKNNLDSIKYICHDINKKNYELIDSVDKVYIGNSMDNTDKLKIINYCSEKGKTIYLIPSMYEISLVDFKVSQADDLLVFKLEDLGLTFEQRIIKRILDIILSFMGLIILSPLLITVAIIIKLQDGGTVFFKQERVTENNRIFNLYKFRTMVEDAEKHTGPVLATEKDNRITRIGRLLRASRIDELPQLINVLRGYMSIVGPRPERPFFVEQFNEEIDGFKYRVSVKAGITGLAQILSNYTTDPKIKAKYDLLYIKKYSVLSDIKIIFNTIKIIFMKNSSKGIIEEKELEELFKDRGLNAYNELGVTKIE